MTIIEKGWGQERIWVSRDEYCSKFLDFNTGARFSCHFHKDKIETWYVMSGKFDLLIIDTETASWSINPLLPGDVHHNDSLVPHQLICIEAGTILEVSTKDTVEDNYRVMKGDSQENG